MIRKNSAIKKNNFLANTNSNNNKTELPVNLSLFKTTHERKKDLDNSNLSARSGTEINFLEKKGVLDWESDDSGLSEGEKIKKNREKFLENLNKNMQKDEFEKLNEKMTFTLDIDSKNNLNDNYNRNIINKTEKSNSLPLDKGSIDLKVYESKKKLEELEKIRLLEEKGKLEKLDNEKQTKSNEIMELNKKEKNLEKKLENLMNAISAKSTEIKSLESEENRKNKLIYDQDKEILKKIQELQELEVRFADLQQPKALINESSFPGLTTLQLQKLVKLQGIMKKVFCFSYIEKQKTNKVLVKGKDVLFPCLERNRYTKSLLKSQRKCDLLIFFEKPTRFLKYIVLIKKPSIDVYQHCFNMKEILKEKKPSLDLIQTLCKTIMNELNGCLILLENKRLCLEEFIVNNKNNLKITFAEKYELIYLNPIYSKIIGKVIYFHHI